MEARLASVLLLTLCYFSFGAGYRTENFVVSAPDKEFAKMVGDSAEKYRKDLAIQWLGHELSNWSSPCPVQVVFQRHAEGRTSFSFQISANGRGYPGSWDMMVAGSPERILDAVLPHEITHTIFATHFGQPLPRWADEGACTTVEHISERQKNHKMLIEFLTTKRGIPFNQMFRMKEYPRDILPLYAQGYSLARYFIEQKGHQHFIKYLETGMSTEDWNAATEQFYGFDDLSDLQVSWISWIKEGCPEPTAEVAQVPAEQPQQTKQPLESPRVAIADVPDRPRENDQFVLTKNPDSSSSSSSDGGAESGFYINLMQRQGIEPDGRVEQRFKADSKDSSAASTKGFHIPGFQSGSSKPNVICEGGTCRLIR